MNGGDNGWNQGSLPYFQQQVVQELQVKVVMGKPGGNTVGYGGHVTGGPAHAWQQQQKPKGTPGGSYSNTSKINNNLLY